MIFIFNCFYISISEPDNSMSNLGFRRHAYLLTLAISGSFAIHLGFLLSIDWLIYGEAPVRSSFLAASFKSTVLRPKPVQSTTSQYIKQLNPETPSNTTNTDTFSPHSLADYLSPADVDQTAQAIDISELPLPPSTIAAGTLRLKLFIDEYGNVQHAEVENSTFPTSYASLLKSVFLQGVFEPALKDGTAARSWKIIEIFVEDDSLASEK